MNYQFECLVEKYILINIVGIFRHSIPTNVVQVYNNSNILLIFNFLSIRYLGTT